MTVQPNEITEVLNRPISQELLARDVTRLAYVARDGTPRNIPIIFAWNGSQIVMCTPKNAPKLQALSENPMVALTIDTEVHPPKILLIRGRAELDFVDGIPDEYLQATSTYEMTPEQRVEWEAEVRSLYHEGMVRIVVTPNWAKLIDFESTLPSAVEELIRQREERQRAWAPRGRPNWVYRPRLDPTTVRGVREVRQDMSQRDAVRVEGVGRLLVAPRPTGHRLEREMDAEDEGVVLHGCDAEPGPPPQSAMLAAVSSERVVSPPMDRSRSSPPRGNTEFRMRTSDTR
jgi:hypothetical protein